MRTSAPVPMAPTAVPEATSDAGLVALWVGNYRSSNTREAYRRDADAFLHWVGKPLREVTLGDVQAFLAASSEGRAPASVARSISVVKSLVSFGQRTGYLQWNVAAPVQLPVIQDRLAERILTEWQVQRMLELERHPRNAAVLRLLYSSGARVSELCGLKWRDCVPREDGGQITVLGKGGKTRAILLPAPIWQRIAALRKGVGDDQHVFRSRFGAGLDRSYICRIVKAAARRAKLPEAVSPHWLRHAHASHALDRQAPVHVVQTTLGHASLNTTTRYSHVRPGESSAKYVVA